MCEICKENWMSSIGLVRSPASHSQMHFCCCCCCECQLLITSYVLFIRVITRLYFLWWCLVIYWMGSLHFFVDILNTPHLCITYKYTHCQLLFTAKSAWVLAVCHTIRHFIYNVYRFKIKFIVIDLGCFMRFIWDANKMQ